MNIFSRAKKSEPVGDNDAEIGLFGKAKMALGGNRRALGDITNSVAGNGVEQAKDGAKKTMSWFQGPVSSGPTSIEPLSAPAPIVSKDDERSYMQRESDDVDARDAQNPLLCSEYVNEMYDIFRASEKNFQVNANYMSTQPFINEKMRTILVDWLVPKLLISLATQSLTIRYFLSIFYTYKCYKI